MADRTTIKCPFCERGYIVALYTPQVYGYQITRAASNKKTIPKLYPEKFEVLTEQCPVCGKPRKEIQKVLKEGKKPSREEIIKRAKEAGLPLKF